MRGGPWTPERRAAGIEADLNRLRDELLSVGRSREGAVMAAHRAEELLFKANAAIVRADEEAENIRRLMDEQIDLLNELIPRQRRPS